MLRIVKKILLVGGVLLGLLVLAFFALGFIFPKLENKTRIEIDKPRELVWNYFVDEGKMSEWMPNLKQIELVGGRRHEVGSRYRMTFEENGRRVVMEETLTEFRPNELFAFHLENEIISDDVRVNFTEENGKTVIVQEDSIVGGNAFWRSLFVLARSGMQSSARKYYENLKRNVERLD
ncbi:MAG: SRPBCC family protein [Acidobacteria bacterium]|nr:SRPBCC family protein [Acidobacteriota bacterium]